MASALPSVPGVLVPSAPVLPSANSVELLGSASFDPAEAGARAAEAASLVIGSAPFRCPHPGCASRRSRTSSMRVHLNGDHPGFLPSTAWLEGHLSRACPGCQRAVVSLRSVCTACRNPLPAKPPRADALPSLPPRPRPAPVSLQSAGSSTCSINERSGSPVLDKDLLSICKLTTPMLKYLPKRAAPLFAHTSTHGPGSSSSCSPALFCLRLAGVAVGSRGVRAFPKWFVLVFCLI